MKVDARKLRALVKSRGLTNTTLAAEAGITRQALQVMLRGDHLVEVREKTAKGLARALRLPDEGLLAADPLLGYKEAVAEEHADLTFRGLGLPTAEPKSMDDQFVPIRVVRRPGRKRDRGCQPETAESVDTPVEEPDEVTVEQCLALHRRILISGEPGSGKTTALRHTARAYAKGVSAETRHAKPASIPLLIPLADFGKARQRDSDLSLVRFAVTRTLRNSSPAYWAEVEKSIQAELDQGTCLALLDGLDEVSGDKHLADVLRTFIKDHEDNQFVVTSRIVGLDADWWEELGFGLFQVARWRKQDIQEFARRWYAARPGVGTTQKKQLAQRAEELTTTIFEHKPLRAIASNPLMLTILAALHHAEAKLPRKRVDLYGKIVEVMLESWEASKRGARPGDPLHGIGLEAREFRWLLERIALRMQRKGRIVRPHWWVNEFVQEFLREVVGLEGNLVKEQSERVIRYLCERSGLLVERGDGLFGFWHRTFQEYFAARGLLLEAEEGGDIITLLRPYLFHPQWEEVVVLVAASLVTARATSLLRVILDDPDPAGRFLRRGQRLALRCLVDGAAVADRALLGQVFADGNAIGGSRWLGTSIAIITYLKQLLVTRHEGDATRMLGEIEDAARTDLPEVEYVTVYLSLHGVPGGPRNGAPGEVYKKCLGGRDVRLVWPAWERRIEDPDAWYAEVIKSARDRKLDTERRITRISFLGSESGSHIEARHTLEGLLVSDRLPAIRTACADALQDAAATDPKIVKLFLDRLDNDSSDAVRERCAVALRGVASHLTNVRVRLEALFASGPGRVRAGAAIGLSQLDFTAPEQSGLLERLLTTIASPTELVQVRCASIWAVASSLGRGEKTAIDRTVEACLDDPDVIVSRAANHALADAISEGRREWSPPLVQRIETMLMAVPDPCPHLYGDLVALVAMKEIHGGQRLERLLRDALASFGDLIAIAFVFGSVARLEQVQDSDIDLMIVGDVRLKDLAAALHAPEQTLGRTVNPVLFSREKFREQYREGNPFLLDVVRKEKIFLKGTRDELTELVAERSLD